MGECAWQSLVIENLDVARKAVHKYCRGWEWRGYREDFEGEAMLALVRAARSFPTDSDGNFRKWAAICIRNRLFRVKTEVARKSAAVSLTNVMIERDEEDYFEAGIKDRRRGQLVEERLEEVSVHLSPSERQLVSLMASGLAYPEIGKQLGISSSGVNGRVSALRQRVRRDGL